MNLCELINCTDIPRKYKNTNCRFNFGKFFSERTVVSEPLPETMPSEQKQAILLSRKDLLSKVKLYMNENLILQSETTLTLN